MRSRYAALVANIVNPKRSAEIQFDVPEPIEFENLDNRVMLSHSDSGVDVGGIKVVIPDQRESSEEDVTFVVEREEVKNTSFEIRVSDPLTREFIYHGIVACGGSVVTEDADFVVSDSEEPHGNVFCVNQLKFAYQVARISRKTRTLNVAIVDKRNGEKLKKSQFPKPEILMCGAPVISGSPFHRPKETRKVHVYGSDASRRKIMDAPDSGYCQICGVKYTDKCEHRESESHKAKAESPELWAQFDDFVKDIYFID